MIVSTLLLILFICVNVGLARFDAYLIKNNIRIRHAVNSIVYISFILLFYKWLTPLKILGLLLVRIPVFNTFLNYCRGKELIYISNTTTSIIDKITNFIPKKIGYWNYCICLFIISLILILI